MIIKPRPILSWLSEEGETIETTNILALAKTSKSGMALIRMDCEVSNVRPHVCSKDVLVEFQESWMKIFMVLTKRKRR